MLRYVFRLILKRNYSFFISVFSLALATASLIACVNIYQVLINGKPVGTHYDGTEVSLFTDIPSYNMSFTLNPEQIINLRNELDEKTELIVASGARAFDVMVNDSVKHMLVDSVSGNFFQTLKVKYIQGNDIGFKGDQPTCILSNDFLERTGLQAFPQLVHIAGKSYKVIGVVDEFKGLLDSATDIWVPWQHANNILFPTLKDKGLLGQPELYRALIITQHDFNNDQFKNILKNIQNRTDLLQPPFEGFKTIRGITWSDSKHFDAKQSTQLYLYISLLIFIVSVLNLSTWVALTRSSKLNNELTFLKLGIPYASYILYTMFLILIPVIFAFVLAYPLYIWYLHLLQKEPAISELFLYSAEFAPPNIVVEILVLFMFTLIVTYMISWIIARISSVGFYAETFKQKRKSVPNIFRTIMLASSVFAMFSLVFAIFTIQYGVNAMKMFKTNTQPVYFSGLASNNIPLDKQVLLNYYSSINNQNPELIELGVIKYAPLLNVLHKQGYSFKQYGDTNISFVLNSLSTPTLGMLDIELVNGQLFNEASTGQILVDENIEKELRKLTNQSNIIGLKLYDQASDISTIVGVVKAINYSTDPSDTIGVAYSNFTADRTKRGTLVLKGNIESTRLEKSLDQINEQHGFNKTKINSYSELIQSKRNPYISRLLLSLSSAIVAIIISTITLFSIANIDMLFRKKTLAIYSCLGLSPYKLWMEANRSLLLIMIVGFILGLLIFWLNREDKVIQMISSSDNWSSVMLFSLIIMVFIAIISISLAFKKIFTKTSLYSHLKAND